jgi:hypothetical protein
MFPTSDPPYRSAAQQFGDNELGIIAKDVYNVTMRCCALGLSNTRRDFGRRSWISLPMRNCHLYEVTATTLVFKAMIIYASIYRHAMSPSFNATWTP